MNILKGNPTFVLLLGLCPALAVTTSVWNALGMGILTLIALIASNTVIKWLQPTLPKAITLLSKTIIISTFVSLLDLIVQAFLPSLGHDLSIYLPLIVINCLVLCSLPCSTIHALKRGVGFIVALLILGSIRELLGIGTLLGFTIFPNYYPMLLMILPSGAFLILAFIMATITWLKLKRHE